MTAIQAASGVAAGKSDSKPTSVVLVVKGAGNQRPDDTLDLFASGFWAAVRRIEPRATMREAISLFGVGYRASAHDKGEHDHVFEIDTPSRRIWLREISWESGLRPAKPLVALNWEWRMASFVYLLEIHRWLGSALATVLRAYPATNSALFSAVVFAAVALTHVGVFAVGAFALGAGLSDGAMSYGFTVPPARQEIAGAALVFALAILAAPPTSWCLLRWHRLRMSEADTAAVGLASQPDVLHRDPDDEGLAPPTAASRPPALTNALLLVLVFALLYSPVSYVVFLAVLLVSYAGLLGMRALMWRYRPFEASDVETRWQGSPYRPGTWPVARARPALRLPLFMYRGIVAIALPVFFVLLGLSQVFKWSKFLEVPGAALERLLQSWLGGIMGDVVTYAMDPAQAARIRTCVENDIAFFDGILPLPDDDIHIVAHSQGTPITYELLYRHLPSALRGRIRTYVTLGSVLSYYHHSDAVLDAGVYDQRFPVPRYPDDFAPRYRWYNCWNFLDPITEFYGLDEYLVPRNGASLASPFVLAAPCPPGGPPIPGWPARDPCRMPDVHRASPRNIKTPASRHNHSDYWTNQDWVLGPMARRVLGKPIAFPDDSWLKDTWRPGHATTVVAGFLVVTTLAVALGSVALPGANDLWNALVHAVAGTGGVAGGDGPIQGVASDLRDGVRWLASEKWKDIRLRLLVGSIALVVPATYIGWGWVLGRGLVARWAGRPAA